MGLLKTVFEVNLGLFGNKSQERQAEIITIFSLLICRLLVQINAPIFYLSSVTTSGQLPWRISKQR